MRRELESFSAGHQLYDLDQPIGRTVGDVEWYLQALAGIKGLILEPACGNGRVLVPLLEAGYTADGLDHSPEMLGLCRTHCRERGLEPSLLVADMSSYVEPERYSAIVLPRGSIRNIEGRNATRRTLECFRRSLVPGGLLLMDVTSSQPQVENGRLEYWRRDPYLWTRQTVIEEYDPVLNRTLRYGRFEKWRDGELLVAELHRFCLQHWNPAEFEALLAEIGFTDISVRADFQDGKVPAPDTRYWTFRAVRP